MLQKALRMPLWTCGTKSSTLFLSWCSPVYGSSACAILVQLGDLEAYLKVSQSTAVLGGCSARFLLINFNS